MHAGIARVLDVDESRLELQLQGVNHFVFATGVFVDGVSVIDEAVEKYAHVSEDEALFMKNFMSIPFSPAFAAITVTFVRISAPLVLRHRPPS